MDNNFEIDFKSNWYKNCKRRRKENAKICSSCPFKEFIIKEETKEEYDVCDVLHGILYFMKKFFKTEIVTADMRKFHNAFHKLTLECFNRKFFANLLFEKRIGFNYCEQIQNYIDNMVISQMICNSDSFYTSYIILNKLENTFEAYVVRKFSDKEIDELIYLAEQFIKLLEKEKE
jgi:hypothetical protein